IGAEPVIRGMDSERILVTVDGARLNFQSGHKGRVFQDMDLLKRVEVVRGPASVLYGSGALGGVIAMTTKDPSDFLEPDARFGASTKLGFQGVNRELLSIGRLFGRFGKDLEYLFSYTGRRAGDIRLGRGAGRLKESAEALNSGFAKLVYHISPFDDLKLSFQTFQEDGRVPTNTASRTNVPRSISERNTKQFTYRLGYGHKDPDDRFLNLQGNLYLTTLDIGEIRASDRGKSDIGFNTFGFDIRNSMIFGARDRQQNIVTYGIEFYRDDQKGRGGNDQFFPDSHTTYVGLYLQDEFTLWNRLIFIPGVRYDRYVTGASKREGGTENRFNFKAGAVYKLTDYLNLEASFATGFRAPTFGELFITGTHFPGAVFAPNPSLAPERSRNVDVGFRIKRDRLLFKNDRFLFRNVYFRNDFKDFIDFDVRFIPPFGPLEFKQVNVGKALIQGYEMETAWEFYPGFKLSANFTHTQGIRTKGDVPLTSIPPQKAVVGLSYYHRPWDLNVGFRTQIVDNQDRVPNGVEKTPGYTVYDLLLTWRPRRFDFLKDFRLDFGVDNLTNKKYRRHLQNIPEAGINPKFAVTYTRNW
ncbi:MAG: TonB-dependent hemoglobin/transferrin/lactoferrin family receptor, partial [Candidatus Binatia bacterium]